MVKLKNLSRVINACVVLAAAGISISGVAYAENVNLKGATNEELQMVESNATVTAPFGIAGLGVAPLVMLTVGRDHNLFSEAYSDYTDIDGDGKLDIMFDPSISYFGLFDNKFCYKYKEGISDLKKDTEPLHSNVTIQFNSGKRGKWSTTYNQFPGYWYPVGRAGDNEQGDKGYVTASLSMWSESDRPTRKVAVCDGNSWSGNFLNYVTSSRIDVIRKVLYGGARVYNNTTGAGFKAGKTRTTKYVYSTEIAGKKKTLESSLLAHSRVLRDSHAWGKVLSDLMYEGQFTVNQFTDLDNTGNAENAWFFIVASPDDSVRKDNDDDNAGNSFRWTSTYMRYALVKNAGMPGRTASSEDAAYIWDWASRQTFNQDDLDAIGSDHQKRIDRKNKASGSSVSNTNLFDKVETKNIAVVACTEEFHDNDNCMNYGTETNPIWQPTGLLQQYGQGASPRMRFGLITGGWSSNIEGGILRANIGDFTSEIRMTSDSNHSAGDFDFSKISCAGVTSNGKGSICGLIATFDRMNISAKHSGSNSSSPNGGGVYNMCSRDKTDNGPLVKMNTESTGMCHDWGNPVGEILYETARYFQGRSMYKEKTDFEEGQLKMGHVKPTDPYPDGSSTYCAKPVALLIADENISFDSTKVKPNAYDSDSSAIVNETGTVSDEYGLAKGSYYMGAIRGENKDSGMYEFIPSRKEISNLNEVVGLAPAAAFSAGSYNVAGVASLYSKGLNRTSHGPNNKQSDLYMSTYVVAMKPNVPQINVPINTGSGTAYVEILPFAKTPSEDNSCETSVSWDPHGDKWYHVEDFSKITKDIRVKQSTNQVADFYVEKLSDNEGVFRISYEDFEYGSDYDMDWVVAYKYQVLQGKNGTYIRVMLTHEDGDPYAPQHAGYVITGVENEGVYVDLGKVSAKNNSGCVYNLYELDTVINDASIDSCKAWNRISADGSTGLTQVANVGKNGGDFPDDLCLFPADNYIESSYSFWNSGNIDDYYDKFIKPHANIYYGNRSSLVSQGYWQYARFDQGNDFKNGNDKYNYRLHGDHYSSMGYKAADNKSTVTTSRTFKVKATNDNTGWLKSPLWYAAKYGLSQDPKAPSENRLQRKDPSIEPSNYYLVTNPIKLRDGIAQMLNKIVENVSSSSSLVLAKNGDSLDQYSTAYEASTWFGELVKRVYSTSSQDGTTVVTYNGEVAWHASETFAEEKPDNRLVLTLDTNPSASSFKIRRFYAKENAYDYTTWNNTPSVQGGYVTLSKKDGAVNDKYLGHYVVSQLLNDTGLSEAEVENADNLVYADKVVRWVLGDHLYEGLNTSDNYSLRLAKNENKPLRYREYNLQRFVLGDIINSDAAVFSVPGAEKQVDAKGNEFIQKYIAVGANDGMLHIINERNGKPIVSYLPSVALSSIGRLVKETYASDHMSFVDSTPEVITIDDKVYLYGTYGMGLRGGYLLNVTAMPKIVNVESPEDRFQALNDSSTDPLVVWELRDNDSDLVGKQRVAPTYIRVKKARESDEAIHYLVYGSGYDAQKSGLLFVDMFNLGEHCSNKLYAPCVANEVEFNAEDPWGYNRKNALGPVNMYTLSDKYAIGQKYDAMYVGDLFGNIWKMDLDSFTASGNDALNFDVTKWGSDSYSKPQIIFKALDSNGVAQPITSAIAVDSHPYGGVGLIFGTGGLWTAADQGTVSLKYNTAQSLYMLRDRSSDPDVNVSSRVGSTLVHKCYSSYSSDAKEGCLVQYVFASDDRTSIVVSPSTTPKVGSKIFGWFLDLADADGQSFKDGARIYRAPNIVDSFNFSVPVNMPNVSDTCNGGGTSYLVTGDWTLRSLTKLSSPEVYNGLLSEGRVFMGKDGKRHVAYPLDSADKDAQKEQVDLPFNSKVVSNSSWIKLY
ncbi:pilus assembly protein [Ruminobacter sp.]|uniref:pilus assembly protein n=1 Tax=Ruminobacter sp. TaxID=2774296 RepID=UPI003864F0BE